MITLSTVLVKQHFVADGLAGFALACLVYRFTIAGYESAPERAASVAYTWRGPLAYLGFHLALVGAFYLAFTLGWEPFR